MLAPQLAALLQVTERLPSVWYWPPRPTYGPISAAVGCSLGALGFLAPSIFPAKFRYLANDSALLEYALGLIGGEQRPDNQAHAAPVVALHC